MDLSCRIYFGIHFLDYETECISQEYNSLPTSVTNKKTCYPELVPLYSGISESKLLIKKYSPVRYIRFNIDSMELQFISIKLVFSFP
jgi:hypothetical protein